MKSKALILTFIGVALVFKPVLADDFHYRNILVGERASGLGGAYVSLSDDPSGVYHNPAGIIFGLEDYFSLSANTYTSVTHRYKKIIQGQDYVFESQALVPTFFGFTQSMGKLKWGFAVVVPDSQLFDQDDTIRNISTGVGAPSQWKIRYFYQDTTYLIGPAVAFEVKNNFTVGISLFSTLRFEKIINDQLILYNADSGGLKRYYMFHSFLSKDSYGILPKMGMQWMPIKAVALGLTLSKQLNLTGSGKTYSVSKSQTTATGDYSNDLQFTENLKSLPGRPAPVEIVAGTTFFVSKDLLFTFDLSFDSSDDSYDAGVEPFIPQATINWAGGAEYFWSRNVALRGGVFSNNANTPEIVSGQKNQPPNVDLLGLSGGLSFLRPGSSFSIGAIYQTGSGKGQKLFDVTNIQNVSQNSFTIFLTGSYQL